MDRSFSTTSPSPSRDASPDLQAGLSPDLPSAQVKGHGRLIAPPQPAPEPAFKPAPNQRPVISVPGIGSGVRLDVAAVGKALDKAMEFRSKVPYLLDTSTPEMVLVVPPEGTSWSGFNESFLNAVLRDAYGSASPLDGEGQGILVTASVDGAREAARDRDVLLARKELRVSNRSFTIETPEGILSRNSPWGQVDHATWYGPGIVSVATPSHGGFLLSAEANERVPEPMRFSTRAYEEDCEWSRVACAFPDLFTDSDLRSAHHTMKEWNPDEYGAWTGRAVSLEESHTLRERQARRDFKESYVTLSAISGRKFGAPDGLVLVMAGKGGRMESGSYPPDTRNFLVPIAEYDAERSRSPIGFIIDPARHPEVKVASAYPVWLPQDQMAKLMNGVLKDDELYPNLAAKVAKGMTALDGLGWYGNLEGREAQRLKEMAVALMEGRIIFRPEPPEPAKKTIASVQFGQTTVRLVQNA